MHHLPKVFFFVKGLLKSIAFSIAPAPHCAVALAGNGGEPQESRAPFAINEPLRCAALVAVFFPPPRREVARRRFASGR